ncbi:MAG: hypothetical protein ACYCOU_18425, partial [Sulfobacillus sp.]
IKTKKTTVLSEGLVPVLLEDIDGEVVLGIDVTDASGRVLIKSPQILDTTVVEKLTRYGIREIYIVDPSSSKKKRSLPFDLPKIDQIAERFVLFHESPEKETLIQQFLNAYKVVHARQKK